VIAFLGCIRVFYTFKDRLIVELSQLKAFERAAREGSFTRAAEALQLTQPAVSARIAALEKELGGELFERTGRQLRLTTLGIRFLPYAERALAVLEDGIQEIDNYHKGGVGEVKMAALSPYILNMLPDPLEQFRLAYPAVDIRIWQRLKNEQINMLYDGVINVGLINAPIFDQNLTVVAQFQESIRGVVSVEHPLAQQQTEQQQLMMDDIYHHTIFRVTMSPRMTAFIDAVVEQGRRGSGGAVVAVPMLLAIRLVILGQGVAFLPESYAQRYVDQGRLTFLNIADMPQILNEPMLVALRGRKLDFIHQEFIRIFKENWRYMMV
jgi:DNA-binding transcriptional LysR family regulator